MRLPFDNRNESEENIETGLVPAADGESVAHDPPGHPLLSVGSDKPRIAATVTTEPGPGGPGPAMIGFPVAGETDLVSATATKAERAQQIAPAHASSAAEATSSPEVIETGFPVTGRVDHAVTATVTNLECLQQIAPADASDAEKNRKFLENVVVWPDRNDTGWINMHVIGYGKDIGWPFRNIDAFANRARWADSTSNFFDLRVCMSQQSQCTTTPWGKPKAVSQVANATWLRSIWINCRLNCEYPEKVHQQKYQTSEEAWEAIVTFRQKLGLPFPSAVVDYWSSLQAYWISETPLTPDEWRPYAEGLSFLLRRERVKCETTCNSAETLPVPGIWCPPPRPATLVHLGRQYDFSNFSVLRNTAIEPQVSPAVGRRRKSRRVSGDQK